ncbi:MAG TPA: phenylalanine--tRNA ligase subunit alpha [Candidatus Babeliales bacterium]|nr:phenylalanine--tRNA ligase subunit alpha [Candidatus Babeliales bacterium]
MEYKNPDIAKVAKLLKEKLETLKDKRAILRSAELTSLYEQIKELPAGGARAEFGKEVNALKNELTELANKDSQPETKIRPIDITAPFDINVAPENQPRLLPAECGSQHPLTTELELVLEIFARMGFTAVESREIDDDYHMFTSLNFPPEHPARDDYDTFVTDEGLIAPAHTSTMQNRVLRANNKKLKNGQSIAYVIPGRCFRNEDVDARHDHTFYQLEGVYVNKNVNVGNLLATLKTFFQEYFQKELKVKTQPFYFPFTEPSLEFAASCPFCDEKGCNICSYSGWIELLGCGLINPNVLKEADIDPSIFTGFAWGGGIERLVMIKYGIEDIRHFESANLKFLRQFS